MNKVFKNMGVFALWLAGLVIMAHLFIPHDHHSESSVFNMEDACHSDSNDHSHQSPAHPFHCHALNDLTFKNTSQVLIADNNFPTCDLFTFNFFDSVTAASNSTKIRIKDFQKPFITICFLRVSPFRGPPSLG